MRLLSINIGSSKPVSNGTRTTTTGINKTPVPEAEIFELGVNGDLVSDKKNHGGKDQAIYVYSADDYAWWAEQLGYQLEPGTFGENLTFSNFPETVRIGDRFTIGAIVLEVTAPRIPCWVLANRMDDLGFVKKFADSGRPGFYARVLKGGKISSGETISVEAANINNPSITEMFALWYNDNPSLEVIERLLAAPIAERARNRYTDLLSELEASR